MAPLIIHLIQKERFTYETSKTANIFAVIKYGYSTHTGTSSKGYVSSLIMGMIKPNTSGFQKTINVSVDIKAESIHTNFPDTVRESSTGSTLSPRVQLLQLLLSL